MYLLRTIRLIRSSFSLGHLYTYANSTPFTWLPLHPKTYFIDGVYRTAFALFPPLRTPATAKLHFNEYHSNLQHRPRRKAYITYQSFLKKKYWQRIASGWKYNHMLGLKRNICHQWQHKEMSYLIQEYHRVGMCACEPPWDQHINKSALLCLVKFDTWLFRKDHQNVKNARL